MGNITAGGGGRREGQERKGEVHLTRDNMKWYRGEERYAMLQQSLKAVDTDQELAKQAEEVEGKKEEGGREGEQWRALGMNSKGSLRRAKP